jgi:hypothetical protein
LRLRGALARTDLRTRFRNLRSPRKLSRRSRGSRQRASGG